MEKNMNNKTIHKITDLTNTMPNQAMTAVPAMQQVGPQQQGLPHQRLNEDQIKAVLDRNRVLLLDKLNIEPISYCLTQIDAPTRDYLTSSISPVKIIAL